MKEKGLSLIELMVAILIVAILVAIAVPWYVTRHVRARDAMVELNMLVMQQAVENFASMAEGYYPANATALMTEVSDVLAFLGIMSANPSKLAPMDPWNGTGTDTDILLPGNNTYRNPFSPFNYSCESTADEAEHTIWSTAGDVFYTPIGVTRPNVAQQYIISGDGYRYILTLRLTPEP